MWTMKYRRKKKTRLVGGNWKRNVGVGRLIFLISVVSGEGNTSFLSFKITSVLSLYCGVVSEGLVSHTGLDLGWGRVHNTCCLEHGQTGRNRNICLDEVKNEWWAGRFRCRCVTGFNRAIFLLLFPFFFFFEWLQLQIQFKYPFLTIFYGVTVFPWA